MILEQGRRRLRISDGYVPGGMGCRKIDVIEFIAMARKRGRGSVEQITALRSIAPKRDVGATPAFSRSWETPLDCAVN